MSITHAAMITKLVDLQPIKNADRIVSAGVHNGATIIARVVVGINHVEHELGIYFAPDLQLSADYCRENDLIARYEDGKKVGGGYFSDKRRVTTQKFKGVKSEGIWMPLSSVGYINNGRAHVPNVLGDLFNDIHAHDAVIHPICTKYISEHTAKIRASNGKNAKIEKSVIDFPKHKDTPQLIHDIGNIPVGATIIISEKLHGTSHRLGKPLVKQELTRVQRLINYFAHFVGKKPYVTEKYDIVHGTRNVIISAGKIGFHGAEDFRYAAAAGGDLKDGEMVYGEIVGFANGKSIMPPHATKGLKELEKVYGESVTYHYGVGEGACRFYVYRITQLVDGVHKDLSFKEMAQRASELGYFFIVPLTAYITYDGDADKLMEVVKKYAESINGTYSQSIYANHPSEGVVLRIEHEGNIYALKYKSFGFKVLEGIIREDPTYVELEDIS